MKKITFREPIANNSPCLFDNSYLQALNTYTVKKLYYIC